MHTDRFCYSDAVFGLQTNKQFLQELFCITFVSIRVIRGPYSSPHICVFLRPFAAKSSSSLLVCKPTNNSFNTSSVFRSCPFVLFVAHSVHSSFVFFCVHLWLILFHPSCFADQQTFSSITLLYYVRVHSCYSWPTTMQA